MKRHYLWGFAFVTLSLSLFGCSKPMTSDISSSPSGDLVYRFLNGSYDLIDYLGTSDSVIIPETYDDGTNGKASVTAIDSNAFANQTALKSISIPSSILMINFRAFLFCSSLESLTLPSSLFYVSAEAFAGCYSLTSIAFPASLSMSLSDSLFVNCRSLKTVDITLTSLPSIGRYSFSGCVALESFSIPKTVTKIGDLCFNGCKSLESIIIPSSVTYIGTKAFQGSSTTIFCEATSQPSGWGSEWNTNGGTAFWYRDAKPTESGNWWHYVDGKPSVW